MLKSNLKSRFEIVNQSMLDSLTYKPKAVVLDVGHNFNAAKKLFQTLNYNLDTQKFTVVYGTSSKKKSSQVLDFISKKNDELFLVQGNNPRSKPINELKRECSELQIENRVIGGGNISKTLAHIFK